MLSEELTKTVNDTTAREDKLVALGVGVRHTSNPALALVRAAMVWRNRLTHVHSTNRLSEDVIECLRSSQDTIADDYQGLVVAEMVKRIEDGASPRLKEATALIRAASSLTRSLDERICAQLDISDYLDDVLRHYLNAQENRIVRANGLWGGNVRQNRRSILNVAAQAGLRTDAPDPFESELPFQTPKAAVARLNLSWC